MKLLILLLWAALQVMVLSAQTVSNEVAAEIERRVDNRINPSIAIGVVLPNGQVRYYNYGQIDHESARIPDSTTIYEIGSVTKTLTAMLVRRHLSDVLDNSLALWFPENSNANLDRITSRDLLFHTGGLPQLSEQFSPSDWTDPYNGYSDSLLDAELRSLQPDSSKQWSYSNLGYAVLGRIVERVTRDSLETLMGGLLSDMKMEHTRVGLPPTAKANVARPYNMGVPNANWNFTGPSRYAGGLSSCTSDLVTYLRYQQQQNPLFSSDSLPALVQTGISDLGEGKLFYAGG